ncbi:MAG TPA: FtsX-like permease family protein [Bacillota bacterium]|nr:FtsX-like permease family protein [Bacillota bacterium]
MYYQLAVIAWRNLKRKISRTMLLAGSAAITAFILFASYFFIGSMQRSVEASSERLGADLIIVPKGYGSAAGEMIISGNPTPFYMPSSVLEKIRSIPEIEQVTAQLYLQTVSTVCCRTEGDFPIIAFDPNQDFTLKPWLAKKSLMGKYDVIIGSDAGGENFLYHYDDENVEEWITLFGKDFFVHNVLFPTGMGTDKTIFITMDAANELRNTPNTVMTFPPGSVSVVLVKAKPGMESLISRELDKLGLPVDVVKGKGLKDAVQRQVFPVKLLSYLMITLVLVMSSLQVMAMFSALISERRKEIGMMRAMGAGRGSVVFLLLAEAGMVSSIGALIGSLLSAAALYDNRIQIMQILKLPLLFPTAGTGFMIALGTIGITTILSLVAAYLPVRGILKIEPYEAIREGE